ncbi:PAS domain-containing sensor histidine kinase [Rufibacter soli]
MNTDPDFYQSLIEQTAQAFFAYDLGTHQFTFQSAAFRKAFALHQIKTHPEVLLHTVHPEDQGYVQERLKELLHRGESKALEFRIQFPDQEEQWVCLHPAVLAQEGGRKLIAGHAEDITAQRLYNDHLKKFSNKKNSFLNILAHDLAGPLGIIHSLSAQLAKDLYATATQDSLEMIHIIERSSKQGAHLLREFMDQEFLESSKIEVVTRRVNMVEKLREAMEEYEGAKGELLGKKVDFFSSSEKIFLELDDLKFLQVLTNLISNALKFTPDGGRISVSVEDEGHSVLVKVADTGIGIPEKFKATLFDKFTEARRPGLKGEQSVGLGMSIVKTIVEWHKGVVWFESEENKGTTFFIRLPKNEVKPAKE